MKVEMVIDAKNKVGESIVWDNRKNELYWIDIIDQKIHSYDPATKEHMTWQTPDFVTSIGLRKDSGAIVGLKKQLTLWNFDGHFIPLAEIEPSSPDNRLNEGVVGPDLKTLYVTSARFTMDSAHLVEFPHEGALMAVDTGFTGVLTNRFG